MYAYLAEWILIFVSYAYVILEVLQDRLWEAVDKEWMDCLLNEPVEHLLHIPCGVFKV